MTFDVSGWSMTNTLDTKDTSVTVKLGATTLGHAATLDNAAQAALPGFDVTGKASVDVVIPPGTPEGPTHADPDRCDDRDVDRGADHDRLHRDHPGPGDERLPRSAPERRHGATAGAAVLAGAVKQLRGQNPDTVFAAAGDLIGASTFESFIQHDKPTIDALNEAGLEVSAVW